MPAAQQVGVRERAAACFKGLAIGDAIGKQTETLAHSEVRKWYPQGVEGFHGQPGDVIPRYVGKRYEWRVGETTDDTEQTIAVGEALVRAGHANHEVIGTELLRCRKSVHPGVEIWEFQQAADPTRIAVDGDGSGAAMRVSPIGVLHPSDALETIARGAFESSIPTHGGQFGICAAAVVAAAVSAAIEGQEVARVLTTAIEAALHAEAICPVESRIKVSDSIRAVCEWLAGRPSLSADEIAEKYFPKEPVNIVPLAISLALVTKSAEATTLIAANVGGDSDTVASIGSAIAAALCPQSVNEAWFRVVYSINRAECEHLFALASELAEHRLHRA
jgi:ADP-ribosylglycohydrolase